MKQISINEWRSIKDGYCKPCVYGVYLECRHAPCNEAQGVKCCAVCEFRCSSVCKYAERKSNGNQIKELSQK